jgi:hypothetical protein
VWFPGIQILLASPHPVEKPEGSEAMEAKAVSPQKSPPSPQQQQQPQPQQQPQQQAEQPAPRTTTQPVSQSAGGMQTMPGAQPTWPTNAPPAPGPWAGPTR